MKSNLVVSVVAIVIILIGLALWSSAGGVGSSAASVQGVNANAPASALTASTTQYDFGTISMRDGKVHHDFTLSNPTASAITIRGLETSCMCTSALLVESDGSTKGPFGMPGMGGLTTTDDSVGAGESRTLRVIFDPNAHGPAGVGPIDRFITITDSAGGVLRFEIRALVTP